MPYLQKAMCREGLRCVLGARHLEARRLGRRAEGAQREGNGVSCKVEEGLRDLVRGRHGGALEGVLVVSDILVESHLRQDRLPVWQHPQTRRCEPHVVMLSRLGSPARRSQFAPY